MQHDNDNSPPGDLLLGARAIGEFLGVDQRQVYRLIDQRVIPSFKVAGAVSARRSSLTAWMAALERAAA